jgi:hypothetical protein
MIVSDIRVGYNIQVHDIGTFNDTISDTKMTRCRVYGGTVRQYRYIVMIQDYHDADIGVYPISGIPDIGVYPISGTQASIPDIGYTRYLVYADIGIL